MAEVLGREPEKFASTQTAVDMARSAYRQAAHLSPFGTAILGVSCTCALATGRIKKGDHKVPSHTARAHIRRAHDRQRLSGFIDGDVGGLKVCVATHDGQTTRAYTLRLEKGARDRQSEDAVASRLLLKALGVGCGLHDKVEKLDLCLLPS